MNRGGGSFDDPIILPGGALRTTSIIATADVNSCRMVDILLGNWLGSNQLLMNRGKGSFGGPIYLPGGILVTCSIVKADVDNDRMLNILIENEDESNQLLPYNACPRGGAQLHSKSWCFKCPSLMGHESASISISKECPPDYLQQPRLSECGFQYSGKQMLGDDKCSSCPFGSYFNNRLDRLQNDPSTWDDPRSIQCSPGQSTPKDITTYDQYFECILPA